MARVYATGTAAAVNGGYTVTITGGVLSSHNCAADSLVVINGNFNFVQGLVDTTHLTLQLPYQGPTDSGLVYAIYPLTTNEVAATTLNTRTATLIQQLGAFSATGLQPNAVGYFAGRSVHDNEAANYVFLSMDGAGSGNPSLYVKKSSATGDWSAIIALAGPEGPSATDFFDLAVFAQGGYAASDLLLRYEFSGTVAFSAALPLSKFSAGVAPSSSAVLTLKRNGSAFGTVTYSAGVTEAVMAAASDTIFSAGDVLTLYAPATPDATLADIAGTLRGTRDASVALGQTGIATLDFGAFPGAPSASVAVTGQGRVAATSLVNVWLWPGAGTTDHSADEHLVAGINLKVSAVVAGVGFTINGTVIDPSPLVGASYYGQWNVAWQWL